MFRLHLAMPVTPAPGALTERLDGLKLRCTAELSAGPRSGREAASEESKEERQASRQEGGHGGRASGKEEEST